MRNIFIILSLILISAIAFFEVNKLAKENKQLKANQATLLEQYDITLKKAQIYKVRDSLNAAQVQSLTLELKDYKNYRAEDYALIQQLKHSKSELEQVIATQLKTDTTLTLPVTVIIADTTTQYCFDYKSKWLDASGCLDIKSNEIDLSVSHRESLRIVETVTYKRFLGFLWKTNKIKSRQLDILSENPATQIINAEHILIAN